MRVLLAGGGGFIGSHLTDLLLRRGDTVVAVDNFCTGRRANVAHVRHHPEFTLVEHDITTPWPDSIGASEPFDAVLDLASPASPLDFATMPLEILAVGSVGTRRLLDLSRRDGARFFLASTSEVYGDPLVHPQPETYLGNVSCIGPRSCYDEAKRFSEALTMAYHRTHGVDVRIVRIFNTYGERMRPDDGRVVNTFIVQALRGEPITLHGNGRQTRSFCHVADEVVGLAAVLDGHLTGPINVGNPAEFTMSDLAELVVELTGSTSEIIHVELPPEREGDPLQRQPDIGLIRSAYGWEPKISLEAGLQRMIDWFVDHEHVIDEVVAGVG
jgi:nucleoside-diphosphate-sugar epimerase